MLERLLNWIKLRMPVSRREFKALSEWENFIENSVKIIGDDYTRIDKRDASLRADLAKKETMLKTLCNDFEDSLLRIDALSRALEKSKVQVDTLFEIYNDLSMAVKTSNEEQTERFDWLNKRINDLTIAVGSMMPRPSGIVGENTSNDIISINEATDFIKLFKHDTVLQLKSTIEKIESEKDKCPWDLEDQKLGKCVSFTEKEKRIVLSYINEKLHEIEDLRDLTHRDNFKTLEDCQKSINELETLINKFK